MANGITNLRPSNTPVTFADDVWLLLTQYRYFMHLDLTLPLANPVLIFALVLFIILFAPLVLNRLKIPHIIGLIIAGVLIGPYGFNIMVRDSSIVLFGTVGLLYIMFLAGLEIDLNEFKRNTLKSLLFGLYTFLVPMTLGVSVSYYFLGFSLPTAILLASMFASHTLVTYPILSRYGIIKNRAVNITIGGTMITDTLALLVLAVIIGTSKGEIGPDFWLQLSMSVLAFIALVLFGFPIIVRWFFSRNEDPVMQYIFVLGLVFLAAFLSQVAGVEPIIGAFLAGLALNQYIPHTSALMNRIEFVGNALFIPFFLIGVGMLVDVSIIFRDTETIKIAVTMSVVATFAKYVAAFLTQKSLGLSKDERNLIFGLSNAQAAATLAAVLVGFNTIIGTGADGEPIRLLNENVLNGTILMILVTCTIASFATEQSARKLALLEVESEDTDHAHSKSRRLLIPVSNAKVIDTLVGLAVLSKEKEDKLFAAHIVRDAHDRKELAEAEKLIEKTQKVASETDNRLETLIAADTNVGAGLSQIVKEERITDVFLGSHVRKDPTDNFYGNIIRTILNSTSANIFISRILQPPGLTKKVVFVIPENAEYEIGFPHWFPMMKHLCQEIGAKAKVFAGEATLRYLGNLNAGSKTPLSFEAERFTDWEDFLILARDVTKADLFVVVQARKSYISYNPHFEKVPIFLTKYFQDINYLLVYPGDGRDIGPALDYRNPSLSEPIKENFEMLKNIGSKILKTK